MDDFLASQGLWRKPTAKDSSGLFRAFAEQLFLSQVYHKQIREACSCYINRHREDFETEWAGHIEVRALAKLYCCSCYIYQAAGQPPIEVAVKNSNKKVWLCFSNGNHYDSVYPRSYINSAAICQSILYELLYKNVFSMEKPVDQGHDMMHNKHKHRSDSISGTNDTKAESPTHDQQAELDSSSEGKEIKDSTYPCDKERRKEHSLPFPYRVAKALDPDTYRNVEYDTWLDSRKEQQQLDYEADRELQLAPGDKCQISLLGHENKVYIAHIQELSPDKGPVTVFIEELGEKHTVPFSTLKPIPQFYHPSWTMVSGKSYKVIDHKKKNKRKPKDMPMFMPIAGRGHGLPPRLQNTGENMGRGRGQSFNGYRQPPPRFGGHPGDHGYSGKYHNRTLIDSAGHPIKPKWQGDSHRYRYAGRSNSAGTSQFSASGQYQPHFHRGGHGHHGPNGYYGKLEGAGGKQDLEKDAGVTGGATEQSSSLYDELQDRDHNAFPPLSNNQHVGQKPPRSFWHSRRDGVDHERSKSESEISTMRNTPSPCTSSGQSHTQSLPCCDTSLGSGSPSISPPPPPPPGAPQQMAPAMPPQGILQPFYPCLVIPPVNNVNFNIAPSLDPSGSDLPHADPNTLRFFFNLGYEYYRMYTMIQLQHQQQYAYVNPPVMSYHGNDGSSSFEEELFGFIPVPPGSPSLNQPQQVPQPPPVPPPPQGTVYFNQNYPSTTSYQYAVAPPPNAAPPVMYTSPQPMPPPPPYPYQVAPPCGQYPA